MDNVQRFGEFVRRVRKRKGYSVDKLAERSGLSNAQISRIERGIGGMPKVDTVNKIAAGLGMPPADLIAAADLLNQVTAASERSQQIKTLLEQYETSQQIISQSEATIADLTEEIKHLESYLEDPTTDLAAFIELPFITYNGEPLSSKQRGKVRLMLELMLSNQEGEES